MKLSFINRLLAGETIYLVHQDEDNAIVKLVGVGDNITLYQSYIKRKGQPDKLISLESNGLLDTILVGEETTEKEYLKL